MSLFGTERFFAPQNTPQPPQKGPGRYFEVFWQNMGGLMGANLICCAGFLPLALGVSLGLVFENFWLTLLGGGIGGALAGVCWTPMLALALEAFAGGTRGWLARWKRTALAAARPSAAAGAAAGLAGGACLLVGSFAARLLGSQGASPFLVWAMLAVDCLLLSLAAALAGAVLCLPQGQKGGGEQAGQPAFVKDALVLLVRAPGAVAASALMLLLWCILAVGLFPVSVPFALVVGFWPPALFCAQLLGEPLQECFPDRAWPGQEESLPAGTRAPGRSGSTSGLTVQQQSEIFWRRRGPVVIVLVGAVALLAWGGSRLLLNREPDIQIAVVHAEALPDGVLDALEASLAARVGDLNGDGAAIAQVNDYTVVFDGSARDADRQTAGATLLVSDLAMGDSTLYLVEDPDSFLARYADQVEPEALLWADCPALAALDAGEYSRLEQIGTSLPGQQLLGPLTVLVSHSADPAVREALLG